MQANGYGLEWGRLRGRGGGRDPGDKFEAGVDFGGTTNFGLQCYVHWFAYSPGRSA